jgi:hypothetical protein
MYIVQGRITDILQTESGVGKNNKDWHKRVFVIETDTQYPALIAFTAWNTVIDQLDHLTIGSQVEVRFDVSSREYQGKYYSDIKAIAVKGLEEQPKQYATNQDAPPPSKTDDTPAKYGKQENPQVAENQEEDLPF